VRITVRFTFKGIARIPVADASRAVLGAAVV
jgi:hypothetical protein